MARARRLECFVRHRVMGQEGVAHFGAHFVGGRSRGRAEAETVTLGPVVPQDGLELLRGGVRGHDPGVPESGRAFCALAVRARTDPDLRATGLDRDQADALVLDLEMVI